MLFVSLLRTLPGYLLLCGFWSHTTASTGDEEKDTCLLTMSLFRMSWSYSLHADHHLQSTDQHVR